MPGTEILYILVVLPRPRQFQNGVEKLKIRPVGPEREQVAPVIFLHMNVIAHGADRVPMLAIGVQKKNREVRRSSGVVWGYFVAAGWCVEHAKPYQQSDCMQIVCAAKDGQNVNLFLAPL